jgi:hypothetical protein
VGFESERQPTFGSSTDEGFTTTAEFYKIGPPKKCGCFTEEGLKVQNMMEDIHDYQEIKKKQRQCRSILPNLALYFNFLTKEMQVDTERDGNNSFWMRVDGRGPSNLEVTRRKGVVLDLQSIYFC